VLVLVVQLCSAWHHKEAVKLQSWIASTPGLHLLECLPLLAGDVKAGNDGSLSCTDYCTSNVYGPQSYTACTAAYSTVARAYIPCRKIRGKTNSLIKDTCYCSSYKSHLPGVCSVPASDLQPASDQEQSPMNASKKMYSTGEDRMACGGLAFEKLLPLNCGIYMRHILVACVRESHSHSLQACSKE
jgi:hypothetical protein